MTRTIIALAIILFIILTSSVTSFMYIEKTIEEYGNRIDNVIKTLNKNEIKTIVEDWDEEKNKLMFIVNHRDIESVSTGLIRAYHEIREGRFDVATEELAVAKFLIGELAEREKFALVNIF